MPEITRNVYAALNGDQEGFEGLYRATSRAVYFTCLSLVKNETDAEDLTQEVYIAAFEKLPSLSEPERFTAWIKRIAVNKCKDFLTKKGAHPERSLDEDTVEEPVDENILPEEYVENKEKRRIVTEIMRKSLSDAQYRTVIMFYFDDMSVAEIAEVMNCPEGTVKYRLNAARSKIKKGVLDYEHRTDDKLYAFVGAPFLARLLTAESAELAVPAAEIASLLPAAGTAAASGTVAASETAAVQTAARVGAKAFLGTLKGKLIVGAAALVAVCGAAAAIAVTLSRSETPDNTDDSYISDSFPVSSPNNNYDSTDDGDISDSFPVYAPNSGSEDSGEPLTGDYIYEDIPGGIRITKYLGKEEYLTIPAEIDGKKVLEIDDGEDGLFVFYNFEAWSGIKEITLPEGLKRIGYCVFSYLSELETVRFPESLESIGPHAFLSCTSLERIELPDCEIDYDSMFDGCTSLKEVVLTEGASDFFNTFSGCTSLESITIPASAKTLDYTFDGCSALKNVTFAENGDLTEIGLFAFKDCSSLESITIPDGVDELYDQAFMRCTSLKSVTLPDSLEDINKGAFENCSSLEEIVLPNSIRYIHPKAFEGCDKVRIIFKGSSFSAKEISELLTDSDF